VHFVQYKTYKNRDLVQKSDVKNRDLVQNTCVYQLFLLPLQRISNLVIEITRTIILKVAGYET